MKLTSAANFDYNFQKQTGVVLSFCTTAYDTDTKYTKDLYWHFKSQLLQLLLIGLLNESKLMYQPTLFALYVI